MRTRKVGRWCVRLAVVSAVGALAFSQTPTAGAAVHDGYTVITDLAEMVLNDEETSAPAPASSTDVRPEDYVWE